MLSMICIVRRKNEFVMKKLFAFCSVVNVILQPVSGLDKRVLIFNIKIKTLSDRTMVKITQQNIFIYISGMYKPTV